MLFPSEEDNFSLSDGSSSAGRTNRILPGNTLQPSNESIQPRENQLRLLPQPEIRNANVLSHRKNLRTVSNQDCFLTFHSIKKTKDKGGFRYMEKQTKPSFHSFVIMARSHTRK